MSVRRDDPVETDIPVEAVPVARQALAETRLRGLPAAEEYRVIADRLYRHGYRDLRPGALIAWIERSVGEEYERFLGLRSLGERINALVAAGDLAQAAWVLACELDAPTRQRLLAGIRRLDEVDSVTEIPSNGTDDACST